MKIENRNPTAERNPNPSMAWSTYLFLFQAIDCSPSGFGNALFHQNQVIGMARRGLLVVKPIIINLKNDFVGLIAHRKRDVLNMRASQETHDSVVKDSFLIQIGSAQDRVVGLSLVIPG